MGVVFMADTVVDTDTVTHTDTDTTTARGPLMPNPLLKPHPRLMLMPLLTTVDTMAVDTVMVDTVVLTDTWVDTTAVDTVMVDTAVDTDTVMANRFLNQNQKFSHISSPIIELSIYQTRLPPPLTYIQKKVKNIWTKSKKNLNFLKHLVRTVPIMISVISNYPLS